MAISITDPIERAIKRAKLITFGPFNLGKWFTLGFIAFLATLDEGGGNANFNTPGGGTTPPAPGPGGRPGPGPATWPTPGGPGGPSGGPSGAETSGGLFDDPAGWVSSHVGLVILLGLLLLLVIAAISLLVLWVNSRGKFMFIEAVANDTYEVKASWRRHRTLGNSLFKFRAALLAVGFVAVVLILGAAGALAWPDIRGETFGAPAITAIVVGVLLLFPTVIALALVGWAADNFVAHIMYATGQTVTPAWREFRQEVMRGNVGKLVLFLLLQIVLGIGVGIGRLLLGCATCCLGFLPYLSSVVALPLLVFMRAYPMYFMQQFSPRYMIITEVLPPPTGGFPVYPPGWPQGYPPQGDGGQPSAGQAYPPGTDPSQPYPPPPPVV